MKGRKRQRLVSKPPVHGAGVLRPVKVPAESGLDSLLPGAPAPEASRTGNGGIIQPRDRAVRATLLASRDKSLTV